MFFVFAYPVSELTACKHRNILSYKQLVNCFTCLLSLCGPYDFSTSIIITYEA